jgi:glycerol uptake facilitator-like aquaporin
MSATNLVTRRTTTLKAPDSIRATSVADQYETVGKAGGFTHFLWAPHATRSVRFLSLLKSYVMELIGSFFFVFFTVFSVVSAYNGTAAGPADDVLRSILVAICAGGSYFMVTGWLRKPDDELPRHASWLVTLFYMLTWSFGAIHSLIYLIAQLLGALAASGILWELGTGTLGPEVWIPARGAGATIGAAWFAELVGTALILFSLGYNHKAGVETDDEDKEGARRLGETMASLMRAVATLVFFRLGHWTFEPIVYLGGLFATCWTGSCLSNDTGMHYGLGIFLGVPFLGLLLAVVLYLVGLLLSTKDYGKQRKAKVPEGKRVPGLYEEAGKSIHTQYTKVSE